MFWFGDGKAVSTQSFTSALAIEWEHLETAFPPDRMQFSSPTNSFCGCRARPQSPRFSSMFLEKPLCKTTGEEVKKHCSNAIFECWEFPSMTSFSVSKNILGEKVLSWGCREIEAGAASVFLCNNALTASTNIFLKRGGGVAK